MPSSNLFNETFDVVIIGAGIVGCAMARRFTLEGAHVCLVEKATDILDGASKANSAILHTGFDAPPNSVEHKCIQAGHEEYLKIRTDFGLPLDECGAYVVAWNKEQEAKLTSILEKAHINAVTDTKIISSKDLLAKEPNLASHARAAVSIPREFLIDPWSAPYAYVHQALQNGGQVAASCEVKSGAFDGEKWCLQTSRGQLNAKQVINCAGLYGDLIDKALLGETSFKITPRKGQFVVYDKVASSLLDAVVLPVPTARTKGVVLFRTVFGNLAVGPTAEDQESRTDASTDAQAIKDLMDAGVEKIPALKDIPVTAVYAGLRPASEFSDYQIKAHKGKNYITVGAIRSTGLSGALGIAQYVFRLYAQSAPKHQAVENPKIPGANVLIQTGERDWKSKGHGEIVCHCELVTEREIKKALQGPLAAKSLQGLKRQTRVTMGRCQGFFCSARLAELTADCFDTPLSCTGAHSCDEKDGECKND